MKLSELIDFNPRVSLRRDQKLPFVDMASLPTASRDIRERGEKTFSGSGSKFANGDTLLARITPCLENGKGAKVSALPGEAVGHGSTEFIVMRAKNPEEQDFVYYLSREPNFRAFAIQQMAGTSGRQRVSWQSLTDYEIPDFGNAARVAIGRVLSSLDDKISVNEKTSAALEAMAQAIFRDWFVDFGPVRRKVQGTTDPVAVLGGLITNEQAAAVCATQFPDSLGEDGLPRAWTLGVLGDFAETVGSTVEPATMPRDTPYIGLEHMPRRSMMLDQWGSATDVSSAKTSFKKGDVLFGKLRPYFHKVGIAAVDGVCSTDIVVLEASNPIDRARLAACVSGRDFIAFTNQDADGTKMPRTSWAKMKRFPIANSNASVRDCFQKIVGPLFERLVACVSENRALAETRDFLLPRLMSGEVTVHEHVGASS